MLRKENIIYYGRRLLPLILIVLCVCAEKEEVIRFKLDIILKDDMEAILEGVAEDGLLETPYVDLTDYNTYDEGAYSRMAIADFYFLRSIEDRTVKIKRKYRYHKRMGMWDRYYNKYYTVHGDGNETEN